MCEIKFLEWKQSTKIYRGRIGRIGGVCAVFLLCTATAISSRAQGFKVLFAFDGTDGDIANAPLVQGFDGNLYGTTYGGGAHSGGTAFNITTAGTLTTIYNFCSKPNCADGQANRVALTLAANGSFYGATTQGGITSGVCADSAGCGTLFRITPNGVLTTLHRFCSLANCDDGQHPESTLVLGRDHNFYGTTVTGGSGSCPGWGSTVGCGTIFKITPQGVLTTLYNSCSLANCADGGAPGQLVLGTDGNFYGVNFGGGAHNNGGTFFRITPQGQLTTLYNFCSKTNCADGSQPEGIIQATDGDFYGTAYFGGISSGVCSAHGAPSCGTAFKITPAGALTTLYNFCTQANCADGAFPASGVVQTTDGSFYGTTVVGGTKDAGTLFRLTADGSFVVVREFLTNGPIGRVVEATNGTVYGSASTIIYEILTHLTPFVETVPTFGSVGTTIAILGTDFTGATKVSFNGTEATFAVVSSSEIRSTVPTGAKTGAVEVTTPKGTLVSNIAFQVTP